VKENFILSVDWDYFFPDLLPYDWGHRESALFYEMLWHVRVTNRNLMTKERALDVVKPDPKLLDGFWDRVCPKHPRKLIIAESHANIEQFITENSIVYNFDQHHDIQYGSGLGKLDCGNWAGRAMKKNLLKKYVLVYPPWRYNVKETEPRQFKKIQTFYDVRAVQTLADLPKKFDTVFLCRSYAWTPTWCDDAWIEFSMRYLLESKLYASDSAMKVRHPTMPEAINEAEEMEKQLEALRKK
jgi:hypothetical protein